MSAPPAALVGRDEDLLARRRISDDAAGLAALLVLLAEHAPGCSPRSATTDPGFQDAKGLKAYAGAAPITRAPGGRASGCRAALPRRLRLRRRLWGR